MNQIHSFNKHREEEKRERSREREGGGKHGGSVTQREREEWETEIESICFKVRKERMKEKCVRPKKKRVQETYGHSPWTMKTNRTVGGGD